MFTGGAQFVVGWWYRQSAVFYLPPQWFGPVTWWLALPFAPAGSVSCGVWQMACRRVIKVGERVVRDLVSAGECAPLIPRRRPQADELFPRCVRRAPCFARVAAAAGSPSEQAKAAPVAAQET